MNRFGWFLIGCSLRTELYQPLKTVVQISETISRPAYTPSLPLVFSLFHCSGHFRLPSLLSPPRPLTSACVFGHESLPVRRCLHACISPHSPFMSIPSVTFAFDLIVPYTCFRFIYLLCYTMSHVVNLPIVSCHYLLHRHFISVPLSCLSISVSTSACSFFSFIAVI